MMMEQETLVVGAQKGGETYLIFFDRDTVLDAMAQASTWAIDQQYNLNPIDAIRMHNHIKALTSEGE